jgi:putative endonuclease
MAAYVYILASKKNGTLYVGASTDLIGRIYQHRIGAVEGFTKKYQVHLLVHFESYDDLDAAFYRERQIKKWNRTWKIRLIEEANPDWRELYPEIVG